MKQAARSFIVRHVALMCIATVICAAQVSQAADFKILKSLGDKPMQVKKGVLRWGGYYVPTTLETITWGTLPNLDSKPVLSVPSGSVVTFDTVSHEGIVEDQGRDPVAFFGRYGVKPEQVLKEVQEIAASNMPHDYDKQAPHILTGPVEIQGAKAGDVLKIEILSHQFRVPYALVCNRHNKGGALPGEFPETPKPEPGADAAHWERYNTAMVFTPIKQVGREWYGTMKSTTSVEARFPLRPYSGVMGVGLNTTDKKSSAPPGPFGGNLDMNELTAGATLYLPIQIDGAMFYAGDPHFTQGDGEVAINALEGSLRSTFRLTVLKPGDPSLPMKAPMKGPFVENSKYWIPVGLDPDLTLAMKDAVRQTIQFLNEKLNMDRTTALAYASAAIDFQVTQVADPVRGVNAMIRKADFTTAPAKKK
jgi:acetamidase/formamidase